jgi:hypothetical protein
LSFGSGCKKKRLTEHFRHQHDATIVPLPETRPETDKDQIDERIAVLKTLSEFLESKML